MPICWTRRERILFNCRDWQRFGKVTAQLMLQFPTNAAVNVSKSVTLEAAGGAGTLGTNVIRPLHYNIEVDEANTFNSEALRDSGWLTQYGTWKPELKPSTTYFWRVQVQDSSPSPITSGFVATNSFTTMAVPPGMCAPRFIRISIRIRALQLLNPEFMAARTGPLTKTPGTEYNPLFGDPEEWSLGTACTLCGTHWFMASNNNFMGPSTTVYISESGYSTDFPITIRMDYAQDPGTLWGVWCNGINGGPTWTGPDANGVYASSNVFYSADYFASGTNIVLLNRESAPTWTNDPGATFTTNGIWYVKTPDGSNPSGKICVSGFGYLFNIGRSSNICLSELSLLQQRPRLGYGPSQTKLRYADGDSSVNVYNVQRL